MAAGLALLAISRPFEGLLLCVPVAVATLVVLFRRRYPAGEFVLRALVPALAVLVPAALAFLYYDYRVTGNPLRLPYTEHSAQYDVAPPLLLQDPYPVKSKVYRNEALYDFHMNFEYRNYQAAREKPGCIGRLGERFLVWWRFYIGYGLTLPLLALPRVLVRSPRTIFVVAAALVVFGGVAILETFGSTHYTAPAAALLYLPVAQGLRGIALIRRWRPAGRLFAATWLVGCLLTPGFNLFAFFWGTHLEPLAPKLPARLADELRGWLYHRAALPFARHRVQITDKVLATGDDRHLIVVRYAPGHSSHEEFVYNDADIDGSRVVWARDLGPEAEGRLLRYFKDRTVWMLVVNQSDQQLLGPWKGPLPDGPRPDQPPGPR
jgi:hypothetical protein